ncbi:MAG: hypothetical protein WAR24_24235, partial [Candidatus Acidiferrales bacterium]
MDKAVEAAPDSVGAVLARPRWNLAFLALLGYLVVEYSRLQLMYPVLEPLHLAKVFVMLCAVGLLASRGVRAEKHASLGIGFALLAFLIGALFSAIFAQARGVAWPAFTDALRWAVVYFLLSRILTSAWRLRIFAFLFLLLNFKLAQFVIRYYFMERSWGRSEEYLATIGVG